MTLTSTFRCFAGFWPWSRPEWPGFWHVITVHFSLTYNILTTSQPTYLHNLISLQTDNIVPLMLSHLLVHLPPLPLRSQIALFSMPRLISGINFHIHFVNQFHLFMLTSVHPSVLHFPHPSPLHSFTLNSKLTFFVNLFRHRSLTTEPRTDFLG